MDHYIDISDELFLQIQNHELTEIILPECVYSDRVNEGVVLKLYHPADPAEALRVQVNRAAACPDQEGQKLEIELLEWIFQIETELDEQLREEQLWLEGLL